MKVLGISMGRKMGNSEILLKHALKAIEEEDHEVSFLRLHDYKINNCTGCEACTKQRTGGNDLHCFHSWDSDDFYFLMQQVKECNALILAAPAYHLMPPGFGIAMLNRNICMKVSDWKTTDVNGNETDKKICATIGVAGSDWDSLMMPVLSFMAQKMTGSHMKLVDQMLCQGIPSVSIVSTHQDMLDRATQLGKNMARELVKVGDDCTYYGEEKLLNVCPICHSNLLTIRPNGRVTCAFCDVEGDMVLDENKRIKRIDWDGGIEISRWSAFGKKKHDEKQDVALKEDTAAKQGYVLSDEQKQMIRNTVAEWKDYLVPIKPPKAN